MSAWTSAFAPTSMPRVGSSSRSTFGFVHSHLASSTFCWLPPLSSETRWSGLDALMRKRSMNVATSLSWAAVDTRPARESCGSAARTMFSRTERFGMMPSTLRSSDSSATPAFNAAAVLPRRTGRPATVTVPLSRGSAPATAFAVSLRPAPSRPPSPTTSPGRTSKETSWIACRLLRPATSRTGWSLRRVWSPNSVVPCRRTSDMSRPSMRDTSSSRDNDASSPLWTTLPSRITVTVLQMR